MVAEIRENRPSETSEPRASRLDGVLLALMVVALSVQGPDVFAFGGMGFAVGHLLVGVVGAVAVVRCLVSGQSLVLPPAMVHVLLGVFALMTLVDTPTHGFGAMILKYVFQYLVLLVCLNLMTLAGPGRGERCVMAGAWAVLAIVLVNAVAHFGAFSEYYAHPWDGHPNYDTMISGGVNMEATWPAMLGVFFRDDRGGRAYLGLSYLYSALVQSRAGLLLTALSVVYVMLVRPGRPSARRVAGVAAIVAVAVGIALLGPRAIAAQRNSATQTTTVTVADNTGAEEQVTGTPGRLGIWTGAAEAFWGSPITGFGAGQAMDAVRAVTHFPYHEDNVHNYPLQVLLDFGVIGFAAFVVAVARFLAPNLRARLRNPFAAFVVLYLIGGLIQFRGGELLVGFALAGVFAFGPDMSHAREG